MKLPAAPSSGNSGRKSSLTAQDPEPLLRLRQHARPAALLLFGPWLISCFVCLPAIRHQPLSALALMPGLVVAFHLQRVLYLHLAANHRPACEAGPHATLGAANWLTLMRGGAVVALAGFLPAAVNRQDMQAAVLAWTPALIYLGISLADIVDGMVARLSNRETELGKKLDIETDAAGLLIASLVAVALGRLPVLYVSAGCAYYLFMIGIRLRRAWNLPVIELRPRPYARITAGFQMGLVALGLLPLFNGLFTNIAAILFMLPLLLGFARDWLVVSGWLPTGKNQRADLDRWAAEFCTKQLAPLMRLLLLAAWLGLLGTHEGLQPTFGWHLAISLLCLLAVTGFLGRSASLGLVLLLASSHSPFVFATASVVLFISATALLLTGTGARSFWAPEENYLYRRKKK
jgi:CDP-diacylglycerol--glycerol-3-phosphate 3-phosphatidyltransferase